MINTNNYDAKYKVARKALNFVKNSMLIGLGSGSTTEIFIEELAKLTTKYKLNIECVPSSSRTEAKAREHGLRLGKMQKDLDITIDGADWVIDDKSPIIKGYGGALTREKILAYNSKKVIILADRTKFTNNLNKKWVPIEVLPFSKDSILDTLKDKFPNLQRFKWRTMPNNNELFLTDNGNYVLDFFSNDIKDWKKLEDELNILPEVVENGIFNLIELEIITN